MLADLKHELKRLASTPTTEPEIESAWRKGRRLRLQRRAATALSAVAIVAAVFAVPAWLILHSQGSPGKPGLSRKGVTKPQRIDQLAWPHPFVPPTHTTGGRTAMTLIFSDRTVVHLSYPKGLGLASRGVQPTYSYSVKHLPRPNRAGSPFEVLFVHGDIPSGLLDPRPLATFPLTGTTEATLHQVVARGLRTRSNYALLFHTPQWDFVATMPSKDAAHTVAKHLFPSVTTSGWPTLSATGPVRLSVGFGEPRGPQLEIGDRNPSFEMVTTGASREYIVTGIQRCSPHSRLISPPANNGELGRFGAFKCFQLGGGLDVVVSIYGPKHFVHAAFYGLRLSGD